MAGWADIDWEAPRPEWRDIKRSHEHVKYEPFEVDHPDVDAVLEAIRRTHDNGGALFAGFRIVDVDEVIRWFAASNRLDEYDFFRIFVGSAKVRETFPELRVPDPLGRDLGFEMSWSGTLTLDGELAATLVMGGAYQSFEGTPVEAKQLGLDFVDALVQGRHDDFRVYRSHRPWAPWFGDIAWDATWLLIDVRDPVVYLLCVTDTD